MNANMDDSLALATSSGARTARHASARPPHSARATPFEGVEMDQSNTTTSDHDAHYLQKPEVLAVNGYWKVPPVLKYSAAEVDSIPGAAKVHAMSVRRIEKHWRKDVATACLPQELQELTPYSLAFLIRLDEFAYLTAGHHDKAVMMLNDAFRQRRAKHIAGDRNVLSPLFKTVPAKVGKQPKVKYVETEIWENRDGLTLEDLNSAIGDRLYENKKARCAKVPGETKKEMRLRMKKESNRAKGAVEETIRSVVRQGINPRKKGFLEVEKRLERPLRQSERKRVTKARKSSLSGTDRGISYSLAASSPYGSLFTVTGLDSHAAQHEVEEKPAMSTEGLKFLRDNRYDTEMTGSSTAGTRAASAMDLAMDLENMGDQEPAEGGGSGYGAQQSDRALNRLMRKAAITAPLPLG